MIWALGIVALLYVQGSQGLKCYQCQGCSGAGAGDQCTGAWCVSVLTEERGSGTRRLDKLCAQANPAATAVDGCAKETQGPTTSVTRCGCQLEDYCNSDAGMARLMGEKQNAAPGEIVPPPVPGLNLGGNQAPPPAQVVPGIGSSPNQPPPFNLQPLQPNPSLTNGPPPQPLGNGLPFGNPGPQNPNINVLTPDLRPPGNETNPLSGGPPRFPPLGVPGESSFVGTPFSPPQNNVQPSPNIGGGGNQNPQPIFPNPQPSPGLFRPNLGLATSSLAPEPEPSKNTSQQPGGESGGRKPTISNQQKFTCRCEGPMDCKNGQCTDDYCAVIEVDTRDLSHPPGSVVGRGGPNNPNQPANQAGPPGQTLLKHFGCMGAQGLNGAPMAPNKIYPRLPYKFLYEGRQVTVSSNQQFCTGDMCNLATVSKSVSFGFLVLCLSVFFFAK